MASEIQVPYATGATLYANVTNATGAVWNGSAFEAYNGAHYANYVITLSDAVRNGFYVGDFPGAAAGVYNVAVYIQAGGSPAVSDLPLTAGQMEWNGTAEVPLSSLAPAATALSTAQWTTARAANLDNLDAAVSTRAPAATALSSGTWTTGRAAALDNLDAAVSTRLPTASYTAPLDAADTRAAVGLASANLDTQLAAKQATFTAATGVTFPTNFGALAITVGGATTVGTNNDKTGYSLTQAFPANFSALTISAGGLASADVKAINATTVTGDGEPGSPWGPA